MIDIIPFNVTSLKVIHPELNVTLEHASHHFESYVSDRTNITPLKDTITSLKDLIGVFKLLEIAGTQDVAESMLSLTEQLVSGQTKQSDFCLSALSHAYVGLPCYIEYVMDRGQALPILLLPFTNELRAALRKPIVHESQLSDYPVAEVTTLIESGAAVSSDLESLSRRQRQLFQVGLIGLLRDENLNLKLQLMHRSMSRMAQACGDMAVRTQWRLAESVLEGLLSNDLELNFTRKRVLSQLDVGLRTFINNNCDGAITAPDELLKELLFLVNLSQSKHAASKEVYQRCGLTDLKLTDAFIKRERGIMQGPNAETIRTMVSALRDELTQTKEVLEIAAQDTTASTDLSPLLALFQRTSDILSVVGLSTPSTILNKFKDTIQSWVDGESYDRSQLLDIADGLLYVESTLSNLSRLDLDFTQKDESEEDKFTLVAKSQLGEAQEIVIQEAQNGIAVAKKDISSFVESNFDMLHIKNIAETLVSVRGGVAILNLNRATEVLNSCIRFIQNTLEQGVEAQRAQDILETMADALIALEYYLSEIELHGEPPANVLEVAESSLAALGYPVSA